MRDRLEGESGDDEDEAERASNSGSDSGDGSSSSTSGLRGSPSTLTADTDTGSLASTAASPSLTSAPTNHSRDMSGASSLSTPTPSTFPSTFRLFPHIATASGAGAASVAPPTRYRRHPTHPLHTSGEQITPDPQVLAAICGTALSSAPDVPSTTSAMSVGNSIVRPTRPRRLSHTSACENRVLRDARPDMSTTPHVVVPKHHHQQQQQKATEEGSPREEQDALPAQPAVPAGTASGQDSTSCCTPPTPAPGSMPTTSTVSAPSHPSKDGAARGPGPGSQRKKAQVAPYTHILPAAGLRNDRLSAAMSLSTVALAEVANLRLRHLGEAFQQLADPPTGVLEVDLLSLLLRAFGLAEPPMSLVQDVLQRHGGRLTLPAVQEVCAGCLTYPIEAIQRQLHSRCHRYDTAGCGLVSLAQLTELLGEFGLRPSTTAAVAKPFIDENTGLVVYAPVFRHLVSPTHPQTYHALLQAFHLDPRTYIANFHGLPLGFREAALYRLAVADERYTLGHHLLPRLVPHGLPPAAVPAPPPTPSKSKGRTQRSPSCSDSVVSAATISAGNDTPAPSPAAEPCTVLIELDFASGIPLPGLGTAVMSRAVRVCLHRRQVDTRLPSPQSNVLAVAAHWADTTEDEWHFDVEDSANPFIVKTDLPPTSDLRLYIEFDLCTRRNMLRSNASFDLSPSRMKLLTATQHEEAAPCTMSCGWAELDWADVVAQAGKEKTHRLQVWGGEPGDQQLFNKEDVHDRRQGLRKIGKLFRKNTKTQLKLVTRALPASLVSQAAHLPNNVLCSTQLLPFAALYREDMSGLLRGGPGQELSQLAGILHTFTVIADDTQLFLKAFRPVWEATQRDKAFKKRTPQEQFRHTLQRIWPLLHCRLGPSYTVGSFLPDYLLDPDTHLWENRQALLDAFCKEEAGHFLMDDAHDSAPFSTDELFPHSSDPLVF